MQELRAWVEVTDSQVRVVRLVSGQWVSEVKETYNINNTQKNKPIKSNKGKAIQYLVIVMHVLFSIQFKISDDESDFSVQERERERGWDRE